MLIENTEFGTCSKCKAEFNSELMNEYDFDFCPYCGEQLYENTKHEYVFGITETFAKTVSIFARSEEEALKLVQNDYDNGDISVDEETYINIERIGGAEA